MSEGLTVHVEGEAETLRALRDRQTALGRAAIKGLRQSAEIVFARATENLSGRVLKVQTGTLRRRLTTQIFADALQARVGSPVVYAPVHEYGATIQHPGGTAYYFDERKDRAVFLSNKAAAAHKFPRTRPHAITIPPRPWLRPALAASRGDIENAFRRAASEALGATVSAPPAPGAP